MTGGRRRGVSDPGDRCGYVVASYHRRRADRTAQCDGGCGVASLCIANDVCDTMTDVIGDYCRDGLIGMIFAGGVSCE